VLIGPGRLARPSCAANQKRHTRHCGCGVLDFTDSRSSHVRDDDHPFQPLAIFQQPLLAQLDLGVALLRA